MRILFIIVISASLLQGTALSTKKFVIDSSSNLIIKGNSNVNSFACKADTYSRFDTIEYVVNKKSHSIDFLRNEMTLLVNEFDCGNALMTQDFLDALKYKESPFLIINFISLDGIEDASSIKTLNGNVKITLVGKDKNYNIIFKVTKEKNVISLSGKQKVLFSDFGLIPPRKMMGLIRVHEDLEVEFQIDLRLI